LNRIKNPLIMLKFFTSNLSI